MNWKELMLAAFNEPFFNWKRTLSGIDIDNFRARYLDPATGCTVVVQCPEGECTGCDNHGLSICDLSSGITACCRHKYSGPKIPVSTQDLERYSLSYARFHADICRKLSLQFTNTPLGEFFWELGTYKVGTGRNLSVYISYHHTVKALTEQLHGLLSTAKKQFALLVYDYSMISRLFVYLHGRTTLS